LDPAAVPDQDVSEGFVPDFRVVPSAREVMAGSDVQLDFAVRKVGEGN
jgi:hypothetical protein